MGRRPGHSAQVSAQNRGANLGHQTETVIESGHR